MIDLKQISVIFKNGKQKKKQNKTNKKKKKKKNNYTKLKYIPISSGTNY